MKKIFMVALPFVVAAVVESYYHVPAAATWWLGGCILFSGVFGSGKNSCHD